jgi:hypothetical protein
MGSWPDVRQWPHGRRIRGVVGAGSHRLGLRGLFHDPGRRSVARRHAHRNRGRGLQTGATRLAAAPRSAVRRPRTATSRRHRACGSSTPRLQRQQRNWGWPSGASARPSRGGVGWEVHPLPPSPHPPRPTFPPPPPPPAVPTPSRAPWLRAPVSRERAQWRSGLQAAEHTLLGFGLRAVHCQAKQAHTQDREWPRARKPAHRLTEREVECGKGKGGGDAHM